MAKEEQKNMPEEEVVKGARTSEEVTADPTAPGTEGEKPASKRDAFRGRVSKRYPDLNMDDEEAYYDQMGSMMDEYEGYEKNSQKLRDNMSKNPAMAEMLLAARDQEDFDPVVWMVKQKGLDLKAAMDDEEYSEKLVKAHNEYLEKQAKGKQLYEEMTANLPKSLEDAQSAMEKAGLGDKFEDAVGKYFQMLDDGERGIINTNLLIALVKGETYDADVNGAREAGVAEGLNKKVDDKLRKLNDTQEYVAGQQTPPVQKEPKKKSQNMFMA